MSRRLLTGNAAAAWGARLARVDYVPAFPITPQTEIIETLADWIARGESPARLVVLESEHAMITAAGAAAATGVRVFTATSSQGLLYGMEMLYTVSRWRAPFVLINVSRGLATPITLEPDHNDILAARDSGFLQIHCATCQEVLDNVLIAYRLAEDARVRLPVIVNLDGFYLSFTREPVELDLARKVEQAMALTGPRLLLALAPCPTGWEYDPRRTVEIGKLAVQTGVWPLREYRDGRVVHTKLPRRRVPVERWLEAQGRFRHLFEPERRGDLIDEIQRDVDRYWESMAAGTGSAADP